MMVARRRPIAPKSDDRHRRTAQVTLVPPHVAVAGDTVAGLHVASNSLYSGGCQLWPY